MGTIDILLLLALSAIWGSSFIFMRYLAPLIGPIATADMRMLFAGLCLVAFFAATRFSPQWRKNWKHFLVIGLLNSAVPFVLYSAAALSLPASMEAIFNSLSPLFGAIFAAVWLGEALTARKVIGLLLGIAGGVVTSSLGVMTVSTTTLLAILACLLAPACYGLAGVYIKKRAGAVAPMATAGGSQLFGGIALMPFLLVSPPSPSAISATVVLLVLAFAILCSAVAYLIYYRLIAHVGPTKALTVTFLIPLFAVLWGVLFLREGITMSMVAGAAVILLGTFLVAAPGRRPVPSG
jgi:drug/metabolite transporter (DMT)-like permease